MNVSKIKSFFTSNKKSLFYTGFFLFSFFLCSDLAFANNATGSDVIGEGIKIVNFILVISSALLGATTALISLFLTPGWVNGTVFGLDSYMKDIWIMVSNLVYFAFAFILIAIAFMNIIGKGDKWELKAALPKFIVGVIMVPFTWFFVQFVLSISAILTVGVLTLPYDTFGGTAAYEQAQENFASFIPNRDSDGSSAEDKSKKTIPTTFVLDLTGNVVPPKSEGGAASTKAKKEFFNQGNPQEIKAILQGDDKNGHENSIFGVIGLYTYGIMQVQSVDTTNGLQIGEAINTVSDLTLKLIFDAIFVIVYLILMIALFLALLVRGIKLWVYAMLSPAFGLLYFFDKADGVGEGNGKFGIKDFISLALVPVYVAGALSFGLLFIMVASNGMGTSSLLEPCDSGDFQGMDEGVDTGKMTCMTVGSFTFAIEGAHGDSESGSVTGGAFGRIIMELFGIVILWIAVMAALKQSDITNKITEPIQQFGGNVGSLIAKSPMYAPIIPGGLSVQGAQQLSTMAKTHYEGKAIDSGRDFANTHGLFGGTVSADGEKIASEIRNQTSLDKTLMGKVRGELGNYGKVSDIRSNKGAKLMISELAGKLNIEDVNLETDSGISKALYEIQKATRGNATLGGGIFGDSIMTNNTISEAENQLAKLTGSRSGGNNGNSTDDTATDSPTSEPKKTASFVMKPNGNQYQIDLKLKGLDKTIVIDENKKMVGGIDDLSKGVQQGLTGAELKTIFDGLADKAERERVVRGLNDELDDYEISLDTAGRVTVTRNT